MAIGKEFIVLMERIGYSFSDLSYLEKALTHVSYTNEMKSRGIRAESNEALEFLGDAVLEMVISRELFDRYRADGEGTLTKMRQSIVCESALARVARRLSLGDFLNVGNGEEGANVRERDKVLADALEAVIAAVYLDDTSLGGERYSGVILELFEPEIKRAPADSNSDYKTRLQQLIEKNGDSELRYEVADTDGPEHRRTFTVLAIVNNNVVGRGSGRTKKAAQMEAAREALRLFGVI